MIEARILTAIAQRLGAALDPPWPAMSPLVADGVTFGFVDASRRERLSAFPQVFRSDAAAIRFAPGLDDPDARTQALDAVARTLAAEGALTAWRNERYAVAATFGAAPAFHVERAAARYLGIRTYAAHANGAVLHAAGARLWFARRSPTKPIDPSLLDNLVGGGIADAEQPHEALLREAWEEAGIAAPLAAAATPAGALHVERIGRDGLQRETIFAYDLALPASFVPANQDGEAVAHTCVTQAGAAALLANADGPDVVTVDASLVVLDWLVRTGAVPLVTPAARLVRDLRAAAVAAG